MAVLPIHVLGSPVLRQTAVPVEHFDDELRTLVADMYETMDMALGVGLAANQIGIARRVAVVDAEGKRFAMINPVVIATGVREGSEEGCLSIPDAFSEVSRLNHVVLKAFDEQGQPFELELDGLAARAVQHEIDHLDGIMFVDHLPPLKRQFLVRRWKREYEGEGNTWTPKPEESEAAG